ncbi:DNA-binding transcriptional MocR family regulator [Nocardioides luteus]|nr:DNA-binding transcriptional MocR family regulator [Nocardioides luteus]
MTGADFLQLDRADVPKGGLAAWLTAALREAVADGRLAVGSRVPPSRTLATQLGVSRGVVVEAYQRLTDEGLLSARSGGGTRVSAVPGAVRRLGAATRPPTPELDLSPGVPDLSAFPRAAWAKASREALAEIGSAELGYGDPRGVPALRRRSRSGWAAPAGSRSLPTRSWWSTGSPRGWCSWLAGWRSAAAPRSASRSPAPTAAVCTCSGGG